jgi:cyclopropane fatty-acyl-phospholipid synthase-like methyltransferase
LYKNSGRERGTLRFFREKLNRRNVTLDVKHYEDCEQFFASVAKCYVMEALLNFFQMADSKDKPVLNAPHSFHMLDNAYKKSYVTRTLDKFLDEYIFIDEELEETVQTDGVMQLIH